MRNLADEEIRLSTSFLRDVAPEAGRSVEAGLRYTF
jgi:iron complex outermembrane receptor protein